MKIDYNYVGVLEDIFEYGYDYEDPNRKGTFRKEIETVVLKHLKEDGYPIITARKTYFKGAVGELLLFLKGSTNIRDYWKYGIRFWDKDFARYQGYMESQIDDLYLAWKKGSIPILDTGYDMGEIYGYQYKKQYPIFDKFKENPLHSDLIINSWQLGSLTNMALKPCHYDFQIVGSTDGFLIVWNQRSTDFLLGTPINIQFYFLMGLLLEKWSGHRFNGVVGMLKKVHLYDNGFELASKIIVLPEEEYHKNIFVDLNIPDSILNLPFNEFIKHIEPSNFSIKNYNYTIDDKVEMLTYKKE